MKTALLKGKNRWLPAAVLVIAAAAVFIGYRMIRLRRNAQAVREAMNTVETVRAVRQNLIESISVTGTIASADARDVSASAKDVKVLQVNYEEGDYVNAGDVIVVLDSSDLERSLSQARNSQALSEYKENKSIETASRSYSEAVEDGTDEYETAVREEAYEKASENLADASRKNDRNVTSAADSLEQAQMEHAYSNDSSQKTIENYEEQIRSCTVTAPISGVITAMHVAEGDTYQGEGNVLFSVADQEHFIVSASVDEYDISSISKDMAAAVIVEALGEEELPATVSFVSPTVTESSMGSSSYGVEIALDEANTDLRIGMTAKASIVLDAVYDVLTVPYDCVTTDEEGNASVTVDQNGERTEVPVTVGMQGDYYVEVSGEGLEEDMMVCYTNPMTGAASGGELPEGESSFPMPGGMGGSPGGGMPGGGPGGGF